MTEALAGTIHIWATYALVAAAIVGFASERIRVEITSLLVLVALLLLFEFFPIVGPPMARTYWIQVACWSGSQTPP